MITCWLKIHGVIISFIKLNLDNPFFYIKFDIFVSCVVVVPVIQPTNEEFKDLTHVDSYLQKYDELKTKFNNITVNVMNSCPSKNKEPVECTDIPFRQQASVFHPDKNPRCIKEATEKIQKLNTLCSKSTTRHYLLGKVNVNQGAKKPHAEFKIQNEMCTCYMHDTHYEYILMDTYIFVSFLIS